MEYSLIYIIGKFIGTIALLCLFVWIIIKEIKSIKTHAKPLWKSVVGITICVCALPIIFIYYTLSPCSVLFPYTNIREPVFCQFIRALNPFSNIRLLP